MVTVSSSDMAMDGSKKQLIYIFEGSDSTSGSMGPPISLEFRQTIVPRFETPNGTILGICTYSKGNIYFKYILLIYWFIFSIIIRFCIIW